MPIDLPDIVLRLPDWVGRFMARLPESLSESERMPLVIELSRRNIEAKTGGPFGAAIFEQETGKLISVGVNLVVPSACSLAHAEMVAIAIAQKRLGHYDLGGAGMRLHELVTSAEPCAMCFGAIPWSGVRRVVCGARDEDARAIGFDEGPKLKNWEAALRERDILVERDVCRQEARQVLRMYKDSEAVIYNAREGSITASRTNAP